MTGIRRSVALLVLAIAVAVLFYPVLLGEGLLYFRDVSLNHFPNRIYATSRLLSGELPLWNPYLSGGMPLAANPNNLILHPITLLFLVLPAGAAFAASVLLQFLLAAWGMFLWCSEKEMGSEASLLAGAAFAFSGPLVSCGSLVNLLSSWAWVPLALFALTRFSRRGGRWALLGYAGSLALILMTGDLVAAATTVLVGSLQELEEKRSDPAWRRLLPALAGAVLAFCLALVAILPAREMVAASERGSGLSVEQAWVWSVQPVRLLEVAVPSLYGDPTALKPSSYWGGFVFEKGYPFLLSLYLGVITLCLAPLAFSSRRSKEWGIVGVTVFSILASLGASGGLYPLLFRWMPLMDSIRYPSRFMLPAALGLAVLAARGLDALTRADSSGDSRTTKWVFVAVSAILGVGCVAAALSQASLHTLLERALGIPANLDAGTLESIVATLRGSFLRTGVLGLGAAALGLCAARGWLSSRALGLLLVTMAAADLVTAHLRINPVVAANFYEAHPPAADLVAKDRISTRVYTEARPTGFAVLAGSDEAWWGYYWDEVSCRVATCLPWKIPMALDRSTDLLSPAPLKPLVDSLKTLDAVGVKRLCDIASVGLLQVYRDMDQPGLEEVGRLTKQTSVPLRIYRNYDSLPRAYLVSSTLREEGDPVGQLTGSWNPQEEVILEGAASRSGPVGEPGTAEIAEEAPERLVVHTDARQEAWLVVTDNHYPGWRASLDGKEVPIHRANYLFRAVAAPPGTHTVVFRYAPRSWTFGGIGSILSAILAGAWAIRRGRDR